MKLPLRSTLGLLSVVTAVAQSIPAPALLHSTYLGGDARDYAVDAGLAAATGGDGAVYVLGQTSSSPFPHTAALGGVTNGFGTFVTKFTADGGTRVYSTFIAGVAGRALAVDAAGAVYVTGETGGSLPAESAAQPFGGATDAFVLKLTPAGDALAYATYLGGSELELGRSVAVDADGNAYVAGWTTSTNFPVTPGAAQPGIGGNYDAFVAKLAPNGASLVYATFVGGSRFESGAGLALDEQRRVVLVGETTSTNFAGMTTPVRLGAAPGNTSDAYLTRLNVTGTAFEALVLLDGGADDVASRVVVAADGAPVVLGYTESGALPVTAAAAQTAYRGDRDLFVARFNAALTGLDWLTYLGSSARETASDQQYAGGYLVGTQLVESTTLNTQSGGLAWSSDGDLLIASRVLGGDGTWPDAAVASPPGVNGLVAKLAADGAALRWLHLLGGMLDDTAEGVTAGPGGSAWVTGQTERPFLPPYFPLTPDAAQAVFGGGITDAFVTRVGSAPAAPANDGFAQAASLRGLRLTVPTSNAGATKEPNELAHAGQPGGASLWWTWTAPTSGRVTLTTEGSAADTVLAVYTGGSLASLTVVAANDDATAETKASRVQFSVASGQEYRIAVDGVNGAIGALTLNLTFSAPPNDDFANRTVLTGFPVTASGSNRHATPESRSDFGQAGLPGGQSVWWEWTSPTNGFVAVSTSGSDFNTSLGVFTGAALDALTEVKSNDNFSDQAGAQTSQVTFPATAGTRYLFAVDGYYAQAGEIRLSLFPGDPPANDSFANRAPLAGFFAQVLASSVNATFEADANEPALTFTNSLGEFTEPPAGYSVWWTWTAPTNGRVRLTTADVTFDTRVGVFTGTNLGELVRVAANNNRGGSPQDFSSLVEFTAAAGVAYQIVVDGGLYNGHSGRFTLTLALERPASLAPGSVTLQGNELRLLAGGLLPGDRYRLESSGNLLDWTPGEEMVASATEQPLVVPGEGGASPRYFRLVSREAAP